MEICSKLETVSVATMLSALDHVLPHYKSSDLRALVAACWLVCHQTAEGLDVISSARLTTLGKELGVTKPEITREVEYLHRMSDGQDWFEAPSVPEFKVTTQRPTKVTLVRMSSSAIDYESAKYTSEYLAWESSMITKLKRKLSTT